MTGPRSDPASRAHQAAHAVRSRLGDVHPRVAIILGSGLGQLADAIDSAIRIPQSAIPGFPESTVAGHAGELVAGTLEGVPVIVQAGRFHLYEGHSHAVAALPARVFGELGVEILIVTNAAGGVRRTFQSGTLMLIADHLNLMWRNPLTGPVAAGETRFPLMHRPYDGELMAHARAAARDAGVALEEGVYAALLGPSYETPAEVRMLERLGADAVGMSTVPEVLVARARGIRCLGFSSITNPAAGAGLSHEDVLAVGTRLGRDLGHVIGGVLRRA